MATLYYNNAQNDLDWNTLGNWWLDNNHSVPATSLPTSTDSVVLTASCEYNGGSEPTVVNFTMSGSGVYFFISINVSGLATFTNGSILYDTINGDVVFDSSNNAGNITGDVVFNNASHNGTITGTAIFNNASLIDLGTVIGTAIFNDISNSQGDIIGNAILNDYSHIINLTGNAVFNDYSYLADYAGGVDGDVTFNDYSYNKYGIDPSNIVVDRPRSPNGSSLLGAI